MINPDIHQNVKDRIEECLYLIEDVYKDSGMNDCIRDNVKNGRFVMPKIEYYATGSSGGKYDHKNHKTYTVSFHEILINDNLTEYLTQTIPHEIAHLAERTLLGHQFTKGGRLIRHGKYWKHFMQILGADIKRCHNMDTSGVKTRSHPREHVWRCGCTDHAVTKRKHNIMLKEQHLYTCKLCKKGLHFSHMLKVG